MGEGTNWAAVTAYGIMVLLDAAIFGATGYVVFWLGASGWWFLLAMVISSGNSPTNFLPPRTPKIEESAS